VTDGSEAGLVIEDYGIDVYAPDESYYDPLGETSSTDTGLSTADYELYYAEYEEPDDSEDGLETGYPTEDYYIYYLDYDPF